MTSLSVPRCVSPWITKLTSVFPSLLRSVSYMVGQSLGSIALCHWCIKWLPLAYRWIVANEASCLIFQYKQRGCRPIPTCYNLLLIPCLSNCCSVQAIVNTRSVNKHKSIPRHHIRANNTISFTSSWLLFSHISAPTRKTHRWAWVT